MTRSGPYAGVGLGQHATEWLTTGHVEINHPVKRSPQGWTVVQNDVWIGYGAVVTGGKNIVIGHGACIGASTVVTKSIPPYAVAVGNPARIIRYRFPETVIEALLQTHWWTLPPVVIATLPLDDIEACIEELRAIQS